MFSKTTGLRSAIFSGSSYFTWWISSLITALAHSHKPRKIRRLILPIFIWICAPPDKFVHRGRTTARGWHENHDPGPRSSLVSLVRGLRPRAPERTFKKNYQRNENKNILIKTTPNSYIAVIHYRGLEMRLIDKNSTLTCVTSWIGTSDVSAIFV